MDLTVLLVLYGFWALMASLVVATLAREKHQGGFTWFMFSLMLSPIFTAICVAGLPTVAEKPRA